MRFATKWLECFFQRIERGAGIRQNLFAFADDVQFVEAQGADNNNLAIVVIAAGRRAFG
ncbi:hypothetical protein D3C73_1034000 [compost metagenome]